MQRGPGHRLAMPKGLADRTLRGAVDSADSDTYTRAYAGSGLQGLSMGFTRRAEALLGVRGGCIFVRGRYAACYSRRIGVRVEPLQRLAKR